MSGIRKYPKGSTHCLYHGSMDEVYFRLSESGKNLEVFAMGRGEWVKADLPIHFLDVFHKLEDPDAVKE